MVMAIALAPSSTALSPSADLAHSANSTRVDRHAVAGDLDHRVDRRHEVADVAHVGAADDAPADRRRIDHRATDPGRVADVRGDHRPVVDHVGVGVAVPLVIDRARSTPSRHSRAT